MKRIAAAWRLRTVERGHGAPLAVVLVLCVASLLAASYDAQWVAGGLVCLFWVAVWVWGMWDEGGRLVPTEGRSRRRRS